MTDKFLELLEQEEQNLETVEEEVLDFLFEDADEEDLKDFQEAYDITDDGMEEIKEAIKKRVSSRGIVSKVLDRNTRKRRASKTTGMSKAALKRRARKSAKTRKRNPSSTKKATKRRMKAMRKRKQRGL